MFFSLSSSELSFVTKFLPRLIGLLRSMSRPSFGRMWVG